ncbi:CBM96 family carbohydrate-binding protein [Dyadobacter flavalbus]|nr:malectin domain-containing carbohydrate-binding protein [Dyadobacter flavalbus]
MAQPAVEWDKVHSLPPKFNLSESLTRPTPDGGAIMGFSSNSGDWGYFINKFDQNGTKQWEKKFVGDQYDSVQEILSTSDGGYLLGGYSNSGASGDKSDPSFGTFDYWIVKISADGTKQWDKTFGGVELDYITSMKQTADGGYILGGTSSSPANGIKTENSIDLDYWVIKISATGIKQWDKTIRSTGWDRLTYVDQTVDGGYLVGGYSYSNAGGDKSANSKGGFDYWVVKLDSKGSKLWDKTYGGNSNEEFVQIQRAKGGGYILAGRSTSIVSGDKSATPYGYEDFWAIKINSDGEKQWDKAFGGTGPEYVTTLAQTADGGYLISGQSFSEVSGNKTDAPKSSGDYWVVKIDANGNKIWDKSIGGHKWSSSYLTGAFQAPDGGYTLWGINNSDSTGGDKTQTGSDIWIVKILSESNNKKLAFSADSLDFSLTNTTPDSLQNVSLSSNSGMPAVTISKSSADWLGLPSPALGSLPFTVRTNGVTAGKYNAIVAATAPGYARALLSVNLVVNDVTMVPVLRPIGEKELMPGGSLQFIATASTGFGQTKSFSLLNAPAGAAIDAATGAFSWVAPQQPGTYEITVRVSIVNFSELYDQETIKVKVLDPVDYPVVRINAGGKAFTASGARLFGADRYYAGIDRTSSVATGDILNTTDDELYRSGRCSPSFSYNIPVANGKVNVILHFAEIWYGIPGKGAGGAGKRQFNVTIENSRKLTNFDIFAAAGGAMRAVQKSIPVTVTDGMLNIDFTSGAADLPRISAIEVVRTSSTLKPLADSYVRDGSYNATNFGAAINLDIKNNINDLATVRSTYLRFKLPTATAVSSAVLRIYGHNHESSKNISVHAYGVDEDLWTENGIVNSNAPAASTRSLGYVAVNDAYKYYEIDVTSYVKAQQQAGETLVSLQLADPNSRNTRVVFNSKESSSYPPQLIVQTPPVVISNTRLSKEEISTNLKAEPESSSVYPNPVRNKFTIQISGKHSADVTLDLTNNSGQSYQLVAAQKVIAGQKTEVDISNLPLSKGVYLLKVQSSNTSEVLKVLVTE